MLIPWTSSLIAAAAPAVDVADDGTWIGPIALTNTWSADDRMLLLDDDTPVDVRPLPLPVTVQYVTGPRHDGATVGLMTLDEVWRDGPRVMGRGRIDMEDPQGPALARKIRRGFLRFVSADIDKVHGQLVCIDEQGQPIEDCVPGDANAQVGELYTRWRVMGASLLAHPAFPDAQIQLADEHPDTTAPEQEIVGYNPAWGCVRPDGAGGWEPADCDAEDAVQAGPSRDRPYDPEQAALDTVTAAAASTPEPPRAPGAPEMDEPAPAEEPTHAGIALKAADTGRVLLLQRALDDDDPAAGLWEFPGGGIEDDDGDPETAAFREFTEETGIELPDTVRVVDGWRSPTGVYQGYVAILPAEQDIDINPAPDDRDVINPDDPDGDATETVAWWDITDLADMPALRPEVRDTPWDRLTAATAEDVPPAEVGPAAPDAAMAATAHAAFAFDTSLPWAPRDYAWEEEAAADRVEAWATPDGADTFDPDRYRRAFLIVDGDPDLKGSYRFGVADIVDGELRLVWRGVVAANAALNGARGGTNIPAEQKKTALAAIETLYRSAAQAFDDPTLTDSLTAAAVHIDSWLPPTDWFRGPDLTDLQPITVDPDGRVRGYLAAWGVTHRSFPGRAVTPPHSGSGYALFNTRPIHTSEGLVDVGLITMGTGHAALGLDHRAATAHYDDTGTQAAVVRAGEDSRGIWLAGAVLPDLTDEQRLRLSLSRFSGDWRQEGAGLELVAALAVNTEGFPVPVKRRGDQGDYALVAAGALPAPAAWPEPAASAEIAAGSQELRARAVAAAAQVSELRVRTARLRVGHLANWVKKAGGLPSYIKRIAKHLQEQQGFDESRAIATAVNAAKRMCATGDLNFPGVQQINAGSRAEACNAVAEWEAKKAASKAAS